ncbi:MAG: M23 family metallopeptidase [Desulfobacterales bacterium]|nr:M23 family metallopeptidase [Desulfobacterales bacterium]
MRNRLKKSKLGYLVIGIVLCALTVLLISLTIKRMEGEAPAFRLERPIESIGASYTLNGLASDHKSGLRRVWIAILQQGTEVTLLDQTFPSKGFFRGGENRIQTVSLEIKVRELGFRDGDAILRTAVWDYSWRGWWAGNRSYAEHKLLIDTQPASIKVLTGNQGLNQGGAGMAIYRVSEPVATSGVQVADSFFRGFAGHFDNPDIFVTFFAIPYNKGPETQLHVTATDLAGNISRTGFGYNINSKAFKYDTINIPNSFLKRKMPEFYEALEPGERSAALLDKFLAVNRNLRRANHKIVEDTCKNSDNRMYWTGHFLRLPASARKAGFGDRRTYRYRGRAVDKQVHLGIDLASVAYSAVPAANSGRVAFAEDLGIYGRTIIIDHGFGLFSMYGHLSRIQVTKDQVVSKGDVIGFTGKTGLAGGDHLHFAMLIHNTFVNPIEWWDAKWIKHHVAQKLKFVGELKP